MKGNFDKENEEITREIFKREVFGYAHE